MTNNDSSWQPDDSIVEPQGQCGDTPLEREGSMEQQPSRTMVTILHELDLGQHTLFLMSDGSIDVLANDDEPAIYLADNGIRLNADEVYHLFVSLQEQYKHEANRGEYAAHTHQQEYQM